MMYDGPLCGAQHVSGVFHHYEHGDAQPRYARFHGEDGTDAHEPEAIEIYLQCARELGHPGPHLTTQGLRWSENDE
jgi:hypothetical protein